MEELAEKSAELILKANYISVLSGAGISTAAGIPDFRGPQGIYKTAGIENPERIFDINYFYKDPHPFYKFHRSFLETIRKVQPTFTHLFLSRLEKEGKIKGIVTQNIDSLHQKAGSKNIYEIHGGFLENYCTKCGEKYSEEEVYKKLLKKTLPQCDKCGSIIKPDVVLFGEEVKFLSEAENLIRNSDLVLVLGSSLAVAPACNLPFLTKGKVIIVNKGKVLAGYGAKDKIAFIVEEDLDTFFKEVARKYYSHRYK